MTDTPYTIFLRGIDSLPTIDVNSEVACAGASDSLPSTLATPSEANGWLRIGVMGLSQGELDKGDTYKTLGRAEVNNPTMFGTFEVRTGDFIHPDDAADYKALLAELRKRYVVIAIDDYDDEFHAVNRAVVCSRSVSIEHTYDAGSKTITMTLQRTKPYA